MPFSTHPDTEGRPISARKIVVCARCDGRGHFDKTETLNHHKGDVRAWREPCTCCHGSGRMVLHTSLVPYVSPITHL